MSDDCLATHYHDQYGPVPTGPDVHFYVEFDGDSSYIDCGSDASLDNLHAGPFTVDLWLKASNSAQVAFKSNNAMDVGWMIYTDPGGILEGYCVYSVSWPLAKTIQSIGIDTWHHVAFCLDVTTMHCRFAIDGQWCTYLIDFVGAGVYTSDSVCSLRFGASSVPGSWLDGAIQWLRISSGLRWTPGVNFTPPAMCAPPAVDANTIELWAMDEGSGATTAAEVNSPANDGTLTDCIWHRCT